MSQWEGGAACESAAPLLSGLPVPWDPHSSFRFAPSTLQTPAVTTRHLQTLVTLGQRPAEPLLQAKLPPGDTTFSYQLLVSCAATPKSQVPLPPHGAGA